MQTKAAVAHKSGEPLSVENLELTGPGDGECLVEIKATGICHTLFYSMNPIAERFP